MDGPVLVTGGAGFVGSHVVDELLARGCEVRVLDSLDPAVHSGRPGYLRPEAELIEGDLRDRHLVARAVRGVGAVAHQAGTVGLESGFSEAARYVGSNDLGTAVLLGCLAEEGFSGTVALASSMVVYGEGGYSCREHGAVRPLPRNAADLAAGRFEPGCPVCGGPLEPHPLPESAPPDPRSVYAATKLAQERLCELFARERSTRCLALRYHNVYGPRMPRDTPYAGVASIFLSSLAEGRAPAVFEDGGQLRDFIHVRDVARANAIAVLEDSAASGAYNVATGRPRSVGEMARELAAARGPGAPAPWVTGEFRLGDVRHVFADAERATAELGFRARVDFAEGMRELAGATLREPPGRSPDRVEEQLDGDRLQREQREDEAQPSRRL
jgi:dTDP-L-rhamnose 4-epimerase